MKTSKQIAKQIEDNSKRLLEDYNNTNKRVEGYTPMKKAKRNKLNKENEELILLKCYLDSQPLERTVRKHEKELAAELERINSNFGEWLSTENRNMSDKGLNAKYDSIFDVKRKKKILRNLRFLLEIE